LVLLLISWEKVTNGWRARIKIKASKLGSWEANMVIWIAWVTCVYGVHFREHSADGMGQRAKRKEHSVKSEVKG
jgi:hypothetical protein